MRNLKRIIAGALILANAAVFGLPLRAQSNEFTRRAATKKSGSKQTPTVFENSPLVKKYQQTILPENLASRLYFLASDLFEGRETGARGQRLAAQYLASQYRLLGLLPKGIVNSERLSPAAYFQPFNVYREMPKETRLEVAAPGGKIVRSVFSADKSDDLSYFLFGSARRASGGVVFAGYGIADDKLGYNDLAALAADQISINDKWVLILDDEPLADANTSLLPTADKKPSTWSGAFAYKRGAILKNGRPKGILVVEDSSPLFKGTFAETAAKTAENARTRLGTLSLFENSDIPQTYAISTKFANQILAPSGKTVEALRQQINQSLKPTVFDLKDVKVDSTVELSKPLETENVLAFIEGSDPKLKDEVVIISAHYDHLGINPLLKGDQIFNGAADDGSGTVATLELANAFMQAKREGYAPRRSILFVNFAGEEKGLLGSSFYTYLSPVVPLAKTVANINMDGVGGIDAAHPTKSKNYIYIASAEKLSDNLLEINKQVHNLTGSTLEITDGNNRGFRSDSEGFQNQLVPFIYYSTGRTEHYHQASDAPETIDYDHLARVTQLIFAAAWQVANQDARISSVDRSKLKLVGYVCPPCPFDCDTEIHDRAGICPICGMTLMPKYEAKGD
ncbi:MAG TPA: M28 family peptidase [Pyrinomonadaceae bacterium]|jgi:hypothetical protein